MDCRVHCRLYHRTLSADGAPVAKSRRTTFGFWRLVAFFCGVASIAGVWITPLGHLDHHSLTAHMVQHLVLMTVAAPLILLAKPGMMLRHTPPLRLASRFSNQRGRGAPVFRFRWSFPQLVLCWFAGTSCVIMWHVPALFELGMRSKWWHEVEQVTFLGAGFLFWLPVIQQRGVAKRLRWSVPLYLFLATLPCDALSAFLVFCGHVVYRQYGPGYGLFRLSPLEDQALAGALMWVTVTFVYLIPALAVTTQLLSDEPRPTAEIWVS